VSRAASVPVCDACGMYLFAHRDSFLGSFCDLQLALLDLWHGIMMAFGVDYIDVKKRKAI
jgi:hypothetical protein